MQRQTSVLTYIPGIGDNETAGTVANDECNTHPLRSMSSSAQLLQTTDASDNSCHLSTLCHLTC